MSIVPFHGDINRKHFALTGNGHCVSLRLFGHGACVKLKRRSFHTLDAEGNDVDECNVDYVQDKYEQTFVRGAQFDRLKHAKQVHLSPKAGLELLLVPLFVPKRLMQAVAAPSHIEIMDMQMEDQFLTIKVFPHAKQDVLLVDAHGAPLLV